MTTNVPAEMSNVELLDATVAAARDERLATAELLALLAEVDARRLYLGEGCSSLFSYCAQVLHLSEHAAYHRIEAARAARQFPVILERVASGELTLTAVALLRPHLTEENHEALLEAARHKSKRDVECLIACLAPKPAVAPLASDRFLRRVTLSAAAHAKLRRAQDLMRRTIPDGDPGEILDKALTLLVDQLERAKTAKTARPRQTSSDRSDDSGGSRHIPAAVKRAVWARDEGRCAFVGSQGRCEETGCLEYHHLTPYARDGRADVSNIALRCGAHNRFEGELVFGRWSPPTDTPTRSGPS